MKKNTIVLVAGGTGGHLFPAQAVAQVLRDKGYVVRLITDSRGAHYLDGQAFMSVHRFPTAHLRGGFLRKISGIFRLILGGAASLWFMLRQRPILVWGFGGYMSSPPIVAAWLCRIPAGVHQADALLGCANRWLTYLKGIFLTTSFAQTHSIPSGVKNLCTGLPIRPTIQDAARKLEPFLPPSPEEPLKILVLGGSQGASFWSHYFPQALALLLQEQQRRFHIVQQCPEDLILQAQQAYQKTEADVSLTPFVQDVGEALLHTHLVFARAGASTIAELAACGRPAFLVPYPYAADDHQTFNAQQVVEHHGGWLVPEKELSAERLSIFLGNILKNTKLLTQASAGIRRLHQEEAAVQLANFMGDFLRKNKPVKRDST